MTPLQILKLHDEKIKLIEELLEKIDNTNNTNNTNNINNVGIDENNILDILTGKIENMISNKLTQINDTIKSMLLNIEKLSNIAKTNEDNFNKTELFIKELNELKMLVIKNQSLSLETNNDIIKLKNRLDKINNDLPDKSDDPFQNLTDIESIFKSILSTKHDIDFDNDFVNNDNDNEDNFKKINIENNIDDNNNDYNLDINEEIINIDASDDKNYDVNVELEEVTEKLEEVTEKIEEV